MVVRFWLNGRVRVVDDLAPSTMLLAWLREEAALTGTKEGCAEGDCGACTVVVGELDAVGASVQWRPVNACILFMGAIDGKALLTVEGLASPNGELHPVQQAMVDHHASQCGFCTPGFVMTLFAHWRRSGEADRRTLDELFAGNLCRCTGYRPIADAARTVLASPEDARVAPDEASALAELRRWRREAMPAPRSSRGFVAPNNLKSFAAHLEACPDALLLAGGTDAGLGVTKDLQRYDQVVTTMEVRELREIRQTASRLEIGAAVTYSSLLPYLDPLWPDFGNMIRRLGSELIRNSATLAGNLGSASPIGDALPVLLALDASLVLRRGERTRELSIDRFFLDYKRTALEQGEFISQIRLPLPTASMRLVVHKISKRFDQDISAVLLAAAIEVDGARVADARIAFGGMAAVPKRATTAETVLRGAALDAASFEAAASTLEADFRPLSDMRATAGYRLAVARAALLEAGASVRGQAERLPDAPLDIAL